MQQLLLNHGVCGRTMLVHGSCGLWISEYSVICHKSELVIVILLDQNAVLYAFGLQWLMSLGSMLGAAEKP